MSTVSKMGKPVTIAIDGLSDWRIVVEEGAIASETHAARELQHFLREICGAELPIVSDEQPLAEKELIVGDNRHLRELGIDLDTGRLGQDGFVLKTVGNRLVIAGGQPRGTLYGVYSLLEEELGCRWFTRTESLIPKRSSIQLPEINSERIPRIATRTALFMDTYDGDWAARNKINCWSPYPLEEKHGGKIAMSEHFVHTFYKLVPPEAYFEAHPEYFSLVDGTRRGSDAQLCLSHPDVFRIALEQLRRWMDEEPEAAIFGVSQNDCTGACECEQCRALDEEEESPIGSILTFVNRLAEAIEEEYPDKRIETLAYWYSRKPPKHLKPHRNVIIRLCSMECCFMHPLDQCEQNDSFVQDVVGWGKICDQVYIWDYLVDFKHYVMPYPNLRVIAPNIRFFTESNVSGIMAQGAHTSLKTEFAEMKSYLTARLLWNPELDPQTLIQEFATHYYGAAAESILAYIRLLEDRVDALVGYHAGCFDPPTDKYFSPELLDESERLLGHALRLADSPEIEERVRTVHMQVKYTRMMLLTEKLNQVRSDFFKEAEELGITRVTEWKPLEESKERLETGQEPF
ncbi:DUF4838 domain-containing protein [Paenibacillus dendrobii]|nr:DUF4838 domain-containing protein [Paenibacillus dendrobii]